MKESQAKMTNTYAFFLVSFFKFAFNVLRESLTPVCGKKQKIRLPLPGVNESVLNGASSAPVQSSRFRSNFKPIVNLGLFAPNSGKQ